MRYYFIDFFAAFSIQRRVLHSANETRRTLLLIKFRQSFMSQITVTTVRSERNVKCEKHLRCHAFMLPTDGPVVGSIRPRLDLPIERRIRISIAAHAEQCEFFVTTTNQPFDCRFTAIASKKELDSHLFKIQYDYFYNHFK